MPKVTDIQKIKADLAGDLAIQLSKVLTVTEILAEHYHNNAKAIGEGNHMEGFVQCPNSTCINAYQLIRDSYGLIEQGV